MKLIYFILILFLIGCNTNQRVTQNHEVLVNGILSEYSDSLIFDDGVIVFCKSTNNDKIGYLTVYGLRKTYNNEPEYKDIDNRKFVSDFIYMKKGFDCDYVIRCFTLNDTITAFYNQNDFQTFLLKYGEKYKDEYILNKNLSYDAEMSIIYYLYQNNYYTCFDDLIGIYSSSPINNHFSRVEDIELE